MNSKIDDLLSKIEALEQELITELQNQQHSFTYQIHKKRILFEKQVTQQHKHYLQLLFNYLTKASIKNILSAPFIWVVFISNSGSGSNRYALSSRLFSYLWHPQS